MQNLDMALDWAAGPALSPVYVPVYIYSWSHGGLKVRTFVSGADATAVAGAVLPDEARVATLAALGCAGVVCRVVGGVCFDAKLVSRALSLERAQSTRPSSPPPPHTKNK